MGEFAVTRTFRGHSAADKKAKAAAAGGAPAPQLQKKKRGLSDGSIVKIKTCQNFPQNARLVADQIRGLPINKALDILNYSLKSGVLVKGADGCGGDAEHNHGAILTKLKFHQYLLTRVQSLNVCMRVRKAVGIVF